MYVCIYVGLSICVRSIDLHVIIRILHTNVSRRWVGAANGWYMGYTRNKRKQKWCDYGLFWAEWGPASADLVGNASEISVRRIAWNMCFLVRFRTSQEDLSREFIIPSTGWKSCVSNNYLRPNTRGLECHPQLRKSHRTSNSIHVSLIKSFPLHPHGILMLSPLHPRKIPINSWFYGFSGTYGFITLV